LLTAKYAPNWELGHALFFGPESDELVVIAGSSLILLLSIVTPKRDAFGQQTEPMTRALWKSLILTNDPNSPTQLDEEDNKWLKRQRVEDFKLIDNLVYRIYRHDGIL